MKVHQSHPRSSLAGLVLPLLLALAFVAVPSTPASAASGSGNVSRTTGCGDFKSGVRGFINAVYSWNNSNSFTSWTITNRTSTANTYDCSTSRPNSINEIRVRTRIRFAGVGITGCSVSAGGVSCTGGLTERNINLGWASRTSSSAVTQTLSSARFTAGVTHSAENITDGLFIHGAYNRQYWVSHYCAWQGFEPGEGVSCSRRT